MKAIKAYHAHVFSPILGVRESDVAVVLYDVLDHGAVYDLREEEELTGKERHMVCVLLDQAFRPYAYDNDNVVTLTEIPDVVLPEGWETQER